MAKILVKKKAEVFKDYIFPANKESITIGSEADNDLVIDDKKISMNHLKIIKQGDTYFVEDLRSAFGTIVSGQTIQGRKEISDGEEIRIGQHTLIFLDQEKFSEENAASDPLSENNSANSETFEIEDLDITSEMGDDTNHYENIEATSLTQDFDATSIEEAPQADGTQVYDIRRRTSSTESKWPQIAYYLLAVYGPYRGKKYQLNKDETKIGRDTKLNDIIIRNNPKGDIDSSISRRHATITFKDDGFYVSDKRSKTRTYVNQYKLSESDFIRLMPGDEIEIVSDQTSTILRLTTEGDWDFSLPKKAGVWWVRYRNIGFKIISASLLLISIIMFMTAIQQRYLISQRPDKLLLTEKCWYRSSAQNADNNVLEAVPEQASTPAPAIGDLNGDGILDVVFVDHAGIMKAVNGVTKGALWNNETQIYGNKICSPALADLNGNGLVDIILITPTSRILALDGKTGAEIWRSQILGSTFTGRPVVADVNGDKRLDVAISTVEGKIYIVYGRTPEPRWVVIETSDSLHSTISAGDADGDGIDDFVVGTDNGFIIIIDGLKAEIKATIDINEQIAKAQGSFNEYDQIRAPIGLGFFNDDKRLDFVISTNHGNLLALDGKTRKRLWHEVLPAEGDLMSNFHFPAVIGDLNGDNLQDIVIFTLDGSVKACKGDSKSGNRKEILWEYVPEDWEKFI